MYSNSMLPLIYKPTRETDSTATLIDNLFTNNYDVNDQLYQGIFLMDISDHCGIFHILDKYCEHDDCSQLLRVINESKMDRYRECILNIDWNALNVYEDCETMFYACMLWLMYCGKQFWIWNWIEIYVIYFVYVETIAYTIIYSTP